MATTDPSEQSFLRDVSDHVMTVIRDDGVSRHIQFKRPGTRCYQFDLITWPGYLCYCGDMGTFVFSRLDDMFQFFRTDRESRHLRDGQTLAINLGYWAQKLEATDKSDGYKEYDPEQFKQAVCEYRMDWIRDHRDTTTKEDRRELWEAIDEDVLAHADDGDVRAFDAANDFSHRTESHEFQFRDFWEHNFDKPTFRFIWCCYALAWGIGLYDEAKLKQAA